MTYRVGIIGSGSITSSHSYGFGRLNKYYDDVKVEKVVMCSPHVTAERAQELGWSEVICAGVMGNIMAECGGQTLNIDPSLYDAATGHYYGICQWSAKYYGEVHGTSLDFQLKYLKGTVESEFSTFGYLYGGSGFGYENFKQIKRPEDAALAFAECYERCSAKTYYIREENSLKAYSYFTNY